MGSQINSVITNFQQFLYDSKSIIITEYAIEIKNMLISSEFFDKADELSPGRTDSLLRHDYVQLKLLNEAGQLSTVRNDLS